MNAREHFEEGERLLIEARQRQAGSPAADTLTAQAHAHFKAASCLMLAATLTAAHGVDVWDDRLPDGRPEAQEA